MKNTKTKACTFALVQINWAFVQIDQGPNCSVITGHPLIDYKDPDPHIVVRISLFEKCPQFPFPLFRCYLLILLIQYPQRVAIDLTNTALQVRQTTNKILSSCGTIACTCRFLHIMLSRKHAYIILNPPPP